MNEVGTTAVPGFAEQVEQKAAFTDMTSRYPEDQAEEALRDLLATRE